jgi:hypothetical protein
LEAVGSQRQANPEFGTALSDQIRDHTKDSNRCKHQGSHGKSADQDKGKAALGKGF